MKKQIKDLRSWDVKRIEAMNEEHGMDRQGVDIVARSFNITESVAEAMATAIKDRNAPKSPSRSVTETAGVGPGPPTGAIHETAPRGAPRFGGAGREAKIEADGVSSSDHSAALGDRCAGFRLSRRSGSCRSRGHLLPDVSVHISRRVLLFPPGARTGGCPAGPRPWATPFARGLGRQGRPTEG